MIIRGVAADEQAKETFAELAEGMSVMETIETEEAAPEAEETVPAEAAEAGTESPASKEAAGEAAEAAETPEEASEEEPQTAVEEAAEDGGALEKLQKLKAENSDLCGWIYIPGASISYPVMLTPDEPEYYLRRNFYKESSRSGTPFVGKGCTADSDCLVIYGHNMTNGSMFSNLTYYAKKSFWESNKTFNFNTPEEYREYQVFAAVTCRLSVNEEEGFEYYQYSGDMTEAQFTQLKNWLLQREAYDTGVEPEYGDQILILSTCSYRYSDERFIVAAFRSPDA